MEFTNKPIEPAMESLQKMISDQNLLGAHYSRPLPLFVFQLEPGSD
jgi:hypothetical protein